MKMTTRVGKEGEQENAQICIHFLICFNYQKEDEMSAFPICLSHYLSSAL